MISKRSRTSTWGSFKRQPEEILHFSYHPGKHQNWAVQPKKRMTSYSLSWTATLETKDVINSCPVCGSLEKLTCTGIQICCIYITLANSEPHLGNKAPVPVDFILLTIFISAREWKTALPIHCIISYKLSVKPAMPWPHPKTSSLPRAEIAPAGYPVLRSVVTWQCFLLWMKCLEIKTMVLNCTKVFFSLLYRFLEGFEKRKKC